MLFQTDSDLKLDGQNCPYMYTCFIAHHLCLGETVDMNMELPLNNEM